MNDTAEPEEARRRELLVTYQDAPTEPETILSGLTTDYGIMTMYESLYGLESDAWLLHMMGRLPDWWRRVETVHALNTGFGDEVARPALDAEIRMADMSRWERAMLRTGWRVVRTKAGGMIYRNANADPPIVRDAQIIAVLQEFPAPVLGEFVEYR